EDLRLVGLPPGERIVRARVDLAAGERLGRGDDLHVARAAAEVARERLLDGVPVGARLAAGQRLDGDHHPRRAEAALRGVVVVERLLHGGHPLRRAEALHGGDRGALDGRDRQQARTARLAADEDGARAAASLLAARLRARDPELLAQHLEERRQRRAGDRPLDAVHGEVHAAPWEVRLASACSTRRGRILRRYQAEASASSCGLTSFSASAAFPLASTLERRTACGAAPVAASLSSPSARAAATARIV